MKTPKVIIKAVIISAMLFMPFSIFAQIKTEADISLVKIKFADVCSYMASASTDVSFENEKGYAVLGAEYLYPVYDENMFNGIPQTVSLSAGYGKSYSFNKTKLDADIRLLFVNFGLSSINLYSLVELNGTFRHEISDNDSIRTQIIVPVSVAFSANGYIAGLGIGVESAW